MNDYLTKEIKNMSGSFLGIGITNKKIIEALAHNNKIESYELLEEPVNSFLSPKNFKISNLKKKKKTINIKKIKKRYKKKRIDNIICSYKTIGKFTRTFVRDSVYINKGYLYVTGSKDDLEVLKSKYNRYTNNAIIKKEGSFYVLIVNNTNTKNNKIKDFGYSSFDIAVEIMDFLTSLLVN